MRRSISGAHRDDRVARVVVAAEEPGLLERGEALLDRSELGVQLTGQVGVLGRELGKLLEVRDVALERAKRLEATLGAGVLGRDPGGSVGVLPEARLLHLGLEPG
jgi:hypothetical protein